jgi:hypothetical protein
MTRFDSNQNRQLWTHVYMHDACLGEHTECAEREEIWRCAGRKTTTTSVQRRRRWQPPPKLIGMPTLGSLDAGASSTMMTGWVWFFWRCKEGGSTAPHIRCVRHGLLLDSRTDGGVARCPWQKGSGIFRWGSMTIYRKSLDSFGGGRTGIKRRMPVWYSDRLPQ